MASQANDDPRCPECGEPIGATATYCMHCSADLTEERDRADANDDGYWDAGTPVERAEGLLDPDGPIDDTLTAVVGVVGGVVASAIGTLVLVFLTSSAWALLVGAVAGILSAGHLARRPTVHGAVARTAYAVAIALLLVPLVAFGSSDAGTDLATRAVIFVLLLGGVAIPAGIVAGVGFAVSRFAPDVAEEA